MLYLSRTPRGFSKKGFMAKLVAAAETPKPILVSGKGPATRQRLVESARYLFWEKGFAGTSMADLLAHAKVNSGSFYHFFDSKEALLREVLEGYLLALRPMIVDPAYASTPKPIERIFAILAGYRERILMTDSQYGCPLGRLSRSILRTVQRTSLSRKTSMDGLAPFASVWMRQLCQRIPIKKRWQRMCSPSWKAASCFLAPMVRSNRSIAP